MFPSTNLISTISSSTLDLFLLWSFSFYLSSSSHHSNNGLSSACSSPAQVNRISSNRVSSSQRSSLPPSSNCLFLQTEDWTKSQRSCLPGTPKEQWATTTNVECSLTAITSLLSRLKTTTNQTTQKLTFSLQERILRLEKQSLAITRRILRNQLAALKVSFEDFYTNYYNDQNCCKNSSFEDFYTNYYNGQSCCESNYDDNIMIKMTRAAVKVCNQDFSNLRRDTRSSRRVFLTIWKGEKVGWCEVMEKMTNTRFTFDVSFIHSFTVVQVWGAGRQEGKGGFKLFVLFVMKLNFLTSFFLFLLLSVIKL